MAATLWALWIISGGFVNGGTLTDPTVAAYFESKEDCLRVLAAVQALAPTKTMQCIQSRYVIGR